jgi:hypothetical protein
MRGGRRRCAYRPALAGERFAAGADVKYRNRYAFSRGITRMAFSLQIALRSAASNL